MSGGREPTSPLLQTGVCLPVLSDFLSACLFDAYLSVHLSASPMRCSISQRQVHRQAECSGFRKLLESSFLFHVLSSLKINSISVS